MMSFQESLKKCLLQKYCSTSGRASRAEYWWFQLFLWGVFGFLILLMSAVGRKGEDAVGIVMLIFFVLTFLPAFCVFIRRWHDRGISGYNVFWAFLVSIWGVWLVGNIINMFGSDPYENEYGPVPGYEPDDNAIPDVPSVPAEQENIETTDVEL